MTANIKVEGHFDVHQLLGALIDNDPTLIPLFYDLWFSARTASPLRSAELPGPSSAPISNDIDALDVLFIPLLDRVNFSGSCEVALEAIRTMSASTSVGFLQTEAYTPSETVLRNGISVSYSGIVQQPRSVEEFDDAPMAQSIAAKLETRPLTRHLANPEQLRQHIATLRHHVESCRRFLRARETKIILAPVEYLQASSVFLAAAKLENIPFIQLLHGTPVRFYSPFLSDETWVWSERMKQCFVDYGVPPDQLKIVGNLEAAYVRRLPFPSKQTLSVPRQKVLLFFLQDIRKSYCLKDLETLRNAFACLGDEWSLRIRFTAGHDDRDFQSLINEWFGGFDGRVIYTCNRPFLDDLFDADVVCAGTTSATFTAMALGYKALILWNDESYALRGQPMVNPARVCHSAEKLADMVSNTDKIPAVDESELAHIRDAEYMVAAQIISHLTT